MDILRQVIVFDAIDMDAESSFWAGLVDGYVRKDDDGTWHSVIDKNDNWVIGIQYSANHVRPVWPNGEKQQVHLDFHVTNFDAAHTKVMKLGATLLQDFEDKNAAQGFQVYADPSGHPFCLGWGQPSSEELSDFLKALKT